MDRTAHELEWRLGRIALTVRATLAGRRPWRLLVLGSGATGEVTLEPGPTGLHWVSDLELYLESPGPGLSRDLEACRQALFSRTGPAIDLSGADPATVAGFAPRLWLHDASLVASRIDGQDDTWVEPFARFRSCPPGREDALELLANRCGEALDPDGDTDYVRAKLALSLGTALLVLAGSYEPGYAARRSRLRAMLDEPGFPVGLRPSVEAALLASDWKLGSRTTDRKAFLEHPSTSLSTLRHSLRAVMSRLGEAEPGLERPSLKVLAKDWLRVLRHPRDLPQALGIPLSRGPRRTALLDVLDGVIRDLRGEEMRRRHRNWILYAKGT